MSVRIAVPRLFFIAVGTSTDRLERKRRDMNVAVSTLYSSSPEGETRVAVDVYSGSTNWEEVATTRWGRYTTEVVAEVLGVATEAAESPRSALDVGSEGGRWSRLLARRGWAMTCTDVDPRVLSLCQTRIPEAKCILVSADDTTLPCRTEAVNLVLCLEVFSVMDSPWFLPEASRVLPEDGVLVGVVLNRHSLRGMFVWARQLVSGVPARFYKLSYLEWRRRMADAGFDVTFERGYCWFPFTRKSDSAFAPFFVKLERWLGLNRLTVFSPWVVFVAKKRRAVRA